MTIVLVLGAGGSDGGRFIDGALAELAAVTRFRPDHATTIIGTSVGAFRAAAIGRAMEPPPAVSSALRALARCGPTSSLLDRSIRQLRLQLGRTAARLVPRRRPSPGWATPPGPHHDGAVVVSMDLDRRRRTVHRLIEASDPVSAVRASAAVPVAVGPVLLDGHAHGDGAIWSPTSADLAAVDRAATVVVIAPMVPTRGGSLLDRLHRSQLRAELAELPRTTAVVVVGPEPGPRRITRTAQAGAAAVRALGSSLVEPPGHDPVA